jgi:hypothetical protein
MSEAGSLLACIVWVSGDWPKILVEMRGIEPRAFHMQSERSTTELHPRVYDTFINCRTVFKQYIVQWAGDGDPNPMSTAISC